MLSTLPVGSFLLITSQVERFSSRNIVAFPNIKKRIRKNKKNQNLHLGSGDMIRFGERASSKDQNFDKMHITFDRVAQIQ